MQYAIESGLIPADPLENILHPEKAVAAQTKDARQKQFRRGLLNPRAWGSGSQGARIPKSNAEILLSETKGGVDAWKLGHTVDGTKHGFSIENFPNYNEMSKLFGKQQVVTRGLGKYTPGSTATTSSGGTGGTAQPLIPGL